MIHAHVEYTGAGNIYKIRLELDDELRPLVIRLLGLLGDYLERQPIEISVGEDAKVIYSGDLHPGASS